jgi:hypothetical protein
LVAVASQLLGEYRDVWLYSEDKEPVDYSADARGVIDPVRPAQEAQARWGFEERFPLLFAALAYLQVTAPDDPVIDIIALTGVRYCPDFLGFDLWLQRRGMLHLLSRQGVRFVLDNQSAISASFLSYAILRGALSADDLMQVADFSDGFPERWLFGLEKASVSELLAEAIGKLESGKGLRKEDK